MKKLLIYGANGYTAQLIIEMVVKTGLKPIVAGRTASKIKVVAEQYDLPYRIFDLKNSNEIDAALADIDIILHAAGPYIHTAQPMVEGCIRNGCHYLDITGEIQVFELLHGYDAAAKAAGLMVLPGCGFDVVPTDCLAKYLSQQLPDATHLALAFASKGGGLSHGTAMTAVENLGELGAVRQNGILIAKPIGHKTKHLEFGKEFKSFGITIPWGDVATAFYSTGIPNIEVYLGVPESSAKYLGLQAKFNWLLKKNWVRNLAKKIVNAKLTGPDLITRQRSKAYIWGEVRNAKGVVKSAYLVTPETYQLTALTVVTILQKVLDNQFKIGFQTPSNAYGDGLILEIDGVVLK